MTGQSRRWQFGLRGKVLGVLLGFGAVVTSVAITSHLLIEQLESQLLAIYGERVVPLRSLKRVSDRFAIDVVDTVHKVTSGRLGMAQAEHMVAAARAGARSDWQAVVGRGSLVEPRTAQATQALIRHADDAAAQAQELMGREDLAALERFRRGSMYPAIDPLTARLEELVSAELLATDRQMHALNAQLRSLRKSSAVVLIGVSLLALALAAFLMRRFVVSIAAMENVVRGVASGDLSRRVQLRGGDELAHMASDVDHMIDALASSRAELEAHSAALAEAAEQARAASLAKSLFLSGMSHELRTPLNVMLGYAQLMVRESGRSDSDRLALERMVEASRHLLGLIEDVLSISKIEAGKLQLRARPFSPRDMLESVENLFRARAAAKGVMLSVRADAALPERVRGDEGKLRQVLVNLVGNAIKFTAQGEVRVSLWHDGEKLHATIVDTGPGIAKEERARLFETFYQGSAGRDAAEGTGLGLYISSQLVASMGGVLELASELGEGSEFQFYVLAPATSDVDAGPPPLRHIPRLPPGVSPAAMLVVDDRSANRELLGRLLRDMGFQIEEVADGKAAVEACARTSYSLVWMDIRMPGLDGREALRQVRAADARQGRAPRKIVAITASVLELDQAGARAEGFDDLVNKPFRVEEIVAIVESLLGLTLVHPTQSSEAAPGERAPVLLAPWRRDDAELSTLSVEQRSRLLSSLVAGDVDHAQRVIETVKPASLATRLAATVDSFQFDVLIDVLRAGGAHTHNQRTPPP